jgi:hypothetical protein
MMPNMPRGKAISGWRRTFVQESREFVSSVAAAIYGWVRIGGGVF